MSGSAIAPDGFTGTINDSYTVDEWRKAESEGLIFLMMAGEYDIVLGVYNYGHYGRYWTSSPWTSDQGLGLNFSPGSTFDKPGYSEFPRSRRYVIRLVMDE